MIRAVLFDFDDTLVKTKEIRYKALKEAGKKFYNLDISDSDIDERWGKPFNSFISEVYKNVQSVDVLTKNYKSILHKYPNEPFDKTIDVLRTMAEKYLLGIISSSDPGLIESGIKNVRINPNLFFFIQSSEDTNVHKPNPGVFLPTLEILKSKGIDKSEIIYVGDAIDDYVAASKAGFYFCAIANRTVNEKEFSKKEIPFITSIEELPGFISKL